MPALTVVGGGRMGQALVDGLLGARWAEPGELSVVDTDAAVGEVLASRTGVVTRTSLRDLDVAVVAAVIAVKPADVHAVCADLAALGVQRVLSIAAGVRIERLEQWLGVGEYGPAVLRAMPNTPALVGSAASALAAGSATGDADVAWASGILGAVGTVTVVAESLLDAVTGLSGSGPAYVFLLAEALVDAGVLAGLARPVAEALAVQTVHGAGRLLAESSLGAAELRAMVTSPGGTTAFGLRALESAGFRAAVTAAVLAATERSEQLGS